MIQWVLILLFIKKRCLFINLVKLGLEGLIIGLMEAFINYQKPIMSKS
jgi:hypothetical protein